MIKPNKQSRFPSLFLLAAFLLWTLAVRYMDVQAIGPQGSAVGFATVNRFFHSLTGVHMYLYTITDLLSLIPVVFIAGFGLLGLIQWLKRKHLMRVDRSLLILGCFYIVVLVFYILFEMVVINYRPILIDGNLEASYPSSTTLLVLCVMPTAIQQLNSRIRHPILKKCVTYILSAFTVFMVLGRLISGVHWLTDIIGGGLLSAGLVLLYRRYTLP